MKNLKFFFLCYLLSVLLLSFGRTAAYSQQATMTLQKYNFLYKGIEHRFTVNVADIKCSDIIIAPTAGNIRKDPKDSCGYIFSVLDTTKEEVRFYIGVKSHEYLFFIDTLAYRICDIPEAKPVIFGKIKNDFIDKKWLSEYPHIIPVMENFSFDCSTRIIGFSIKVLRKNRVRFERTQLAGNEIPSDIIKILRSGDVLFICDIQAVSSDEIQKQLDNLILIIK